MPNVQLKIDGAKPKLSLADVMAVESKFFVYVEGTDECGEGTRAKIYSFSTKEDAVMFISACLENDNQDLTDIQFIEGSLVFRISL